MASKDRLLALDGVRGAAALWVTLGHASEFYQSTSQGAAGWAINWLFYPHLAVDVFIVLSGYCLMLPAIGTGALRGGTWQFYRRRATRILPPLYASLLLGFLLAWPTARFGQHGMPVGVRMVIANLLLVQDWLPAQNGLNSPTWSVAAELKIYLLFPAILWSRRKAGWVPTALAAAIVSYGVYFAVAILFARKDATNACPWLLLLFVFGCVSCDLSHRITGRRGTIIAWALLVAAAGSVYAIIRFHPVVDGHDQDFASTTPVSDVVMGILSASLLFLVTAGRVKWLSRLAEARWLVFVGTVSYSLYLVHLPILFAVRIVIQRLHFVGEGNPQRLLAIYILGLPLLAGGTWPFFNVVELPFLRRRTQTLARTALDAAVSPAP